MIIKVNLIPFLEKLTSLIERKKYIIIFVLNKGKITLNTHEYLERIKFTGKPEVNLNTLRKLHLNHLLYIPFENLDIHLRKKIVLKPELLYKKIVLNKRGGFCYEMNGLFYEMIREIGFEAKMISAQVYDNNVPGPEFDHMAIIVSLNNVEWLADVGFGDSFLEPLKFETGLIQHQHGNSFRIEKIDDKLFKVASGQNSSVFENMYCFSLIPRELGDFDNMCHFHQTSPQSHFTQKRLITIARPNGRITLSGLKQIITKNGLKTETELESDSDFDIKLNDLFGIEL